MKEVNERSQPTKIHHVIDIEKLLRVDNLGEFINNTFFLINHTSSSSLYNVGIPVQICQSIQFSKAVIA